MQKRLLCLLLVLSLLPINAFAIISPGADIVITTSSSSAKAAVSSGTHTGLALGIQCMDEDKYQITATQKEGADSQVVNAEGLAYVAQHFSYSYPNPYTNTDGRGLVYFLPKSSHTPKWVTATAGSGNGFGWTSIDGYYYRDGSYTKSMNTAVADLIYARIKAGTADDSYFNGIVSGLDAGTAVSLIGYIFGQTKSSNGSNLVNVEQVSANWELAYKYKTSGLQKQDDKTKRKIANYAAILLSLARLLPADSWGVYEDYVADFVVNALDGKPYSPVVITAEMCENFDYEGKGYFNAWRTVPEQVALMSHTPETAIRNADSSPLYVNAIGSGDVNVAQTIVKKARTQLAKTPTTTFGGTRVLGMEPTLSLIHI